MHRPAVAQNVGGFPGYGLTGPETGLRVKKAHTGARALMYSEDTQGGSTDYAYTQVFDLSAQPVTVDANTELSCRMYPQSSAGETGVSGDDSSRVALDIVFTDGTA